MSQTWDLTLVLSPTQSFTADALIVSRQTWDLELVGTQAQITADAIIYDPVKYKTFTADAVVQEYDWYDAEVTTRRTVTFTADAIVSATGSAAQTKTFTADGIITAPAYAATFTADAIVFATNTKTFTADTVIVDSASQSASLSWFFRRRRSSMTQQTKTYTVVQAKGTTRTATWTSPTYLSKTEAGILVVLDVTAASGTGGLTLRINAQDSAGSVSVPLNSAPTGVTATGTTSYSVYPFGAISGALTQSTSGYLPREFSITVTHDDSSSYTYSVGYCLLP